MTTANPVPDWELSLLADQAVRENYTAAQRAGHAVLHAYDRGVLPIDARYLADTLRIVLAVMDAPLASKPDGTTPGPPVRLAHECAHQASNFTPCRICGA